MKWTSIIWWDTKVNHLSHQLTSVSWKGPDSIERWRRQNSFYGQSPAAWQCCECHWHSWLSISTEHPKARIRNMISFKINDTKEKDTIFFNITLLYRTWCMFIQKSAPLAAIWRAVAPMRLAYRKLGDKEFYAVHFCKRHPSSYFFTFSKK